MVTILKLKQQSNIIYVHFISWTFSHFPFHVI